MKPGKDNERKSNMSLLIHPQSHLSSECVSTLETYLEDNLSSGGYHRHLIVASYWKEFREHMKLSCICSKPNSSCFVSDVLEGKQRITLNGDSSRMKEGKRIIKLYYKLKGVKDAATL